MLQIQDNASCSGCGACASACPADCIRMEEDQEGFCYPKISADRCVNCGVCIHVCPILSPAPLNAPRQVYAAISKDREERIKSSSGGIFSLAAKYILDQGGVVFGAKFDAEFNVFHGFVENKNDLGCLRTSKYVQSKIGNAFRVAGEFLKNGRNVLFSGTGCQVGGLKSYLGGAHPNLITMDMICHGAPSPLIWRKYLAHRGAGKKLRSVTFRDKSAGWKHYAMNFTYDGDCSYKQPREKDIYLRGFLENLYLRPSCHACRFKTQNRVSDFTLADFWGVRRFYPEMDDRLGTSLVILHTEAAESVFDAIKDRMILRKSDLESGVQYNTSYTTSVAAHQGRNSFFRQVHEIGDAPQEIIDLIETYVK